MTAPRPTEGGKKSGPYVPPTPDEILRVGEYWSRARKLQCQHQEWIFSHDGLLPTCGDCKESLHVMSQVQLNNLLDSKIRQLNSS